MKMNMHRPEVWYDEKGNPMDVFASSPVQAYPPAKGSRRLNKNTIEGMTRMWVRYPETDQWQEVFGQARMKELAAMNPDRESLADGRHRTCRKRFVESVTVKLPDITSLPELEFQIASIPESITEIDPVTKKPRLKANVMAT